MKKVSDPTCEHPTEKRMPTVAIFFESAEHILNDETPAFKCKACGRYVVPDGALVARMPVIPVKSNKVFCACGKKLEQPYARQRGECIACCLKRLRRGRGDVETIQKREKVAAYRRKRRAEGLAS